MTKTAHTPGPWQRVGWQPCGIYGPGGLDDAERICSMDRRQEHDANARLISAAPELLEALKQAEQQIDYGQIDAAYRIIIAAIAKAEGRS